MTAGYENPVLKERCGREGWSYLWTCENRLSVAQNLAVRCHPAAEWIYKMDEDIFITEGMFGELLDTYEAAAGEGRYCPGIAAPLMAVNGYGYRRILEYLGAVPEYERRFGKAVTGHGAIFSDLGAAEYMWEKTLPLNGFAAQMREKGEKYSVCCHRFSTGCFLMHRDLWEETGGFKAAPEGVLGVDEEH